MKKISLRHLVIIAVAMGASFTSCKKDGTGTPQSTALNGGSTTTAPTAAEVSTQSQSADDLSSVETQSDESMDDVNAILNNSSMRGIAGPCNVTVDTSAKASGIITIDYNGLSCDLKKNLSGSISIQLPSRNGSIARWSDTGVTIGITYNDFKVTRTADSSSTTFNGTFNVTNVTGGNVFFLAKGDSVVHEVRGEMQVTFNDSTTRTWGVSKTRTFINDGGLISIFGSLTIKVTGDTTVNGNTNVSNWGTNRAGEEFSVSIVTPVTIKSGGTTCLFFKQMTGEVVYRKGGNTLTILYGVDQNGVLVTNGSCTNYYKITWADDQGNTKEAVRMSFF